MSTIHEPAKSIPIAATTDLCVVGGSCTGVFAAVRAARLVGARAYATTQSGVRELWERGRTDLLDLLWEDAEGARRGTDGDEDSRCTREREERRACLAFAERTCKTDSQAQWYLCKRLEAHPLNAWLADRMSHVTHLRYIDKADAFALWRHHTQWLDRRKV